MKLVSKIALPFRWRSVAAPAVHAFADEKPKKEKKARKQRLQQPKRNYSKPFITAYPPVADLLNKTEGRTRRRRPSFQRSLPLIATKMTVMKRVYWRSISAHR